MKSYLEREDIDSIRGKTFIELMGHEPADHELTLLFLAASLGLIPPYTNNWKDVVYGHVGCAVDTVLKGLVASGLVVAAKPNGYLRLRDPCKTLVVQVDLNAKTIEEARLYDSQDGKLVEEEDCHYSEYGYRYLVETDNGKRVGLHVELLWA